MIEKQSRKREDTVLVRLLSDAIGVDFGRDHVEVLLSIGRGMFWSQELDMEARSLAKRVDEELELIARMNGD